MAAKYFGERRSFAKRSLEFYQKIARQMSVQYFAGAPIATKRRIR
jgi:hypothetical protein